MRVIMLDIDDCLSTDRSILACTEFDETVAPGYRIPRTGETTAIGLINRACRICDAKVTVISTWLHVFGWDYTHDWLVGNGFDPAYFHQDPAVRFGPRGDKRSAIMDWFKQNADIDLGEVCVVDDDRTLFEKDGELRSRHVVIEGEDGIRLSDYRCITSLFDGSDGGAFPSSKSL